MASIRLQQTLEGHQDRVWHCAWSPNGQQLATCSGDKTRNGKFELAQVLKDHDRTVRRVAFSPDGKLLATASFDSTSSIYELRDGKYQLLQHLEGHENEVKGVAWDCSGKLLATCSRDKSVWIFAWESDMLQMDCVSVGQSHTQDVKSVMWHPTRELLVSCSYDDTLKVWQDDDDDWVCTETIKGHSSTVWDASFEPIDGNFLVSCSEDHSILLWQFSNQNAVPAPGDEISRFRLATADRSTHPRTVYSVDWSPLSPLLVTGCADDAVRIFEITGLPASSSSSNSTTSASTTQTASSDGISLSLRSTQLKAHTSDVNCVKWHPKERIFASCGDDGLVKIWSFESS